jgi:hypothetical protein
MSARKALSVSANTCVKVKLSGDSKRKARLRRDAIKFYVETVCKQSIAEQSSGESHIQEWRFEQSPSQSGCAQSCISPPGERERGIFFEEKYSETPNEDREEEPSSQGWSQEQQWTTQTQLLTACT